MSEPTASEVYAALHRGQAVTINTWVGCTASPGTVLSLGLNGLPSVEVRVLRVELVGDGEAAQEKIEVELAAHARYVAQAFRP